MSTWQPPILAGVLYSRPARDLGPALALLAWCYDVVQTDGTLTINLHVAAADMEMDYPTVKRWWQKLRQSPFITDINDRGRAGIKARLRDEYIDWRIMEQRKTGLKVIPNVEKTGSDLIPNKEEAPPETGSDLIPNAPNEQETGQKRDKNGITFDSPIGIHDIQESLSVPTEPVGGFVEEQSPTKGKPKQPKDPTLHQVLMQAYQDVLGYKIPNGAQEASAVQWLIREGYTVEQVIACYQHLKANDFWMDRHLSLQVVKKNIGAYLKGQTNGRMGQEHQGKGGSVVRHHQGYPNGRANGTYAARYDGRPASRDQAEFEARELGLSLDEYLGMPAAEYFRGG